MIQRSFAIVLLLILAACSSTPPTNLEATAEATAESTAYNFALTQRHETAMGWGGHASFAYPTDWRVRDTGLGDTVGRVTVYGVDGYTFSVSVNNDPANDEGTVERLLNTLNQNASIETVEREGRTIYGTPTRAGNAYGISTYVDGTIYAFIEIVNTRQMDIEPMKETAYAMLLSVELVD